MRTSIIALAALISSLAFGCGPLTSEVDTTECASGMKWVGGDHGDPEMHPGRDCIACHTSRGEGPRFTAAGTVFATTGAADDCFGTPDVTVRLTDADGVAHDLTPNAAGNFYTTEAIAMPYTAELVRDGVTVQHMDTAQTTGACNSCHTVAGTPGRMHL